MAERHPWSLRGFAGSAVAAPGHASSACTSRSRNPLLGRRDVSSLIEGKRMKSTTKECMDANHENDKRKLDDLRPSERARPLSSELAAVSSHLHITGRVGHSHRGSGGRPAALHIAVRAGQPHEGVFGRLAVRPNAMLAHHFRYGWLANLGRISGTQVLRNNTMKPYLVSRKTTEVNSRCTIMTELRKKAAADTSVEPGKSLIWSLISKAFRSVDCGPGRKQGRPLSRVGCNSASWPGLDHALKSKIRYQD